MHGVFRLIQNEVSKIFHHLSWKIITIILMILSAVIPIFTHLTLKIKIVENADYMEKRAAEYEEGSLDREYFLNNAAISKYYESKGYDIYNWRYTVYMPQLSDSGRTVKALELYLSGKYDKGEVIDCFYIPNVWTEYDENGKNYKIYYAPYDSEGNFTSEDGEAKPTEFTDEIARQLLEKAKKQFEEVKKALDTSSYKDYVMRSAERYREQYEQAKTNYALAEAAYKKDNSNLAEYDGAKMALEGYKQLFDALDRTDFDTYYKDVQVDQLTQTLNNGFQAIENSSRFVLCSEREFQQNIGESFGENFITDYGEYRKINEMWQKKYYEVIKICAYGIEHNLPLETNTIDRRNLMAFLSINLTLVCFAAIFMASSVVANEHTSGAIRLLLIRPRARWKILLSKLCCVAFYFLLWTVITSLVTFITTFAFCGTSDLFANYMTVSGGTVKEISPLFYIISQLFLYILPGISMVLLSFMLSVIFKRAGAAMILPLLINIFGGDACHLFWGVALQKLPILRFTPIPYFNLISFTNDPMTQFFGYNSPLNYGLTLNMGLLMFFIYSALIIATAFIVFKKQQVKS